MNNWIPGKRGLVLISALALGASPAFAQTREASLSDDNVVELSPFVVETSRDVGYMAANSISGTRLNMAIKDVPLNLDVITGKLIQDTGSVSLRESLRYSAGIVLQSQSDAFADLDTDPSSAGANDPRGVTRRAGESTSKMRGFTSDSNLQDGFRRNYTADSVNIERVEILRGPSALLYGIGNFGGVVNYITKKPVFEREMYHFGTMVGSHNMMRGDMDINMPLAAEGSWLAKFKPAIRVTAAWQHNEDYTDFYKNDYWVVNTALKFKPFETSTVNLSFEYGDKKEVGVGFQNLRANANDGTPAAGRDALWQTDIYDPETSTVIGHNVDNRTFRWSGKDTYQKGPYMNFSADLEQKIIENMIFKVGYSHSDATFDTRQVQAGLLRDGVLPDSYTDAYGNVLTNRKAVLFAEVFDFKQQESSVGSPPPASYPNGVIGYEWVDVDKNEKNDQIRAELMYRLDLGTWGNHTFVAGTQYSQKRTESDQYGPGYSYGGNPVNAYQRYSYKNPYDFTPIVYGVQGDGALDNPREHLYNTVDKQWNLGYYGVYQGQFFKDKLTIIGGVRWDRSDASNVRKYIYETTHDTEYQGRISETAPSAYSPQVGISYALTDQLSVFGVYSTGVVPYYNDRDGNGNLLAPSKAKNYEVGIKFDLADGKFSGTISAFKIERKGVPRYLWWAPSNYQNSVKGYDDSLPSTTVLYYATPDAMYYGLNTDYGKGSKAANAAYALSVAKNIWGPVWWPLINDVYNYVATGSNIAPSSSSFTGYNSTLANNFWNWGNNPEAGADPTVYPPDLGVAQANTDVYNSAYTGSTYFPLVNYSVPDVAAFMASVHAAPGWKGNYYYTSGATYRYGDGSTGTGNAPDGNGASVAMDDEAKGWDCQFVWTPIPEFQLRFNFSHLTRKITSRTYNFVKTPYWPAGWWYASDPNFGTYNAQLLAKDVYTDVTDSSTYNATIPDYGKSADDSPENSLSIWANYQLKHLSSSLEGWSVGLGGQWEDNRCWYTGFAGGNIALKADGSGELVEYWTNERITLNGMVSYETRIQDKYSLRVALNVDNMTDDTKAYGYVYAPGISYRFSASIDF